MDGFQEGKWRSGSKCTDIRPHETRRLWIEIRTSCDDLMISYKCFSRQLGAARGVNICSGAHFTARAERLGRRVVPHQTSQPGLHPWVSSVSGSSVLGSDLHKWLDCLGWATWLQVGNVAMVEIVRMWWWWLRWHQHSVARGHSSDVPRVPPVQATFLRPH